MTGLWTYKRDEISVFTICPWFGSRPMFVVVAVFNEVSQIIWFYYWLRSVASVSSIEQLYTEDLKIIQHDDKLGLQEKLCTT